MQFTSEQVHWLFGGIITALALALLALSLRERRRVTSFIVPIAFIVAGAALVFDLMLHGSIAPAYYAAEAAQHVTLGALLILVGLAELVPLLTGWTGFVWRLPTVGALFVAGAMFFLHEQHSTGAPMATMVVQHRFFGVTLAFAGVARLWAIVSGQDSDRDRTWLFLILIFGIALLLYSEADTMDMTESLTKPATTISRLVPTHATENSYET